jgi:excisionase family DNA binding protein
VETKQAPQLHRREKVAEKLAISLRATDELILTGKLPSLKIGKRRLVSEEAIAKFIRAAEATAAR